MGKYAVAQWMGVSPWWASLPAIMLIVWTLADANYEYLERLHAVPDSERVRRRLYALLHGPAHSAFFQARDLLQRFARLLNIDGVPEASLRAHLRFAVVQPAEDAFHDAHAVLEASFGPVQYDVGTLILAYRRMGESIQATRPAVQSRGVNEADPEVCQWGQRHQAFRFEVNQILADPQFATLRKIVRGD
jgi:hypothetical protein